MYITTGQTCWLPCWGCCTVARCYGAQNPVDQACRRIADVGPCDFDGGIDYDRSLTLLFAIAELSDGDVQDCTLQDRHVVKRYRGSELADECIECVPMLEGGAHNGPNEQPLGCSDG